MNASVKKLWVKMDNSGFKTNHEIFLPAISHAGFNYIKLQQKQQQTID